MRSREAICEIRTSRGRGTGVLIGDHAVLTALHVVADRFAHGTTEFWDEFATVRFDSGQYKAAVDHEALDVAGDWVVLQLTESLSIRPLPLHELKESPTNWWTYGFPIRQSCDGMWYEGRVLDHKASLERMPAMQLYSPQVAAEHPVAGQSENPLSGLSGAPVIVDGAVVGIIRFVLGADHPQAGTLYAIPVEEILRSQKSYLLPNPDPYSGLPTLPPIDLPQEPFRYLDPYDATHAQVFFGRGWSIRSLLAALTEQPQDSPPCLFAIGPSGVGKSSLLMAGVIPRLERQAECLYFRCTPKFSLSDSLIGCLQGARWAQHEGETGKSLYVIVDQAEELLTASGENAGRALTSFMEDVRAIFGDVTMRPAGRLVLSFVKQRLPEWDRAFREFAVPTRVYQVPALNRQSVREVVLGLASTSRLRNTYRIERVDEELAEEIARQLLRDPDATVSTVLQILMTELWQDAVRQSSDMRCLTLERYRALDLQQLTIEKFIAQQLERMNSEFQIHVRSGLVFDVLFLHAGPKGESRRVGESEFRSRYTTSNERPLEGMLRLREELRRVRLIAPIDADETGESGTKLVHETLVPEIRRLFLQSVLPGQRARRVLESRGVDWGTGQVGATLDQADLALVQQGRTGMRDWSEDEQRLVSASVVAAATRDRVRRILWGVGASAVVAIACLAVGGWMLFRQSAERGERLAAQVTQSRKLVGEGLGFRAAAAMDSDPATAFVLALRGRDFDPSILNVGAAVTALSHNPVWRRIIPPGTWTDALFFLGGESSTKDAIALDSGFHYLVTSAYTRSSDDRSEKSAAPKNLFLYDIPRNQLISQRTLDDREEFVARDSMSTGIYVVNKPSQAGIVSEFYAITPSDWTRVLFSVVGLRTHACASLVPRCVALTASGDVLLIGTGLRSQGFHLAHVADSKDLWINEDGTAVVVSRAGSVTFLYPVSDRAMPKETSLGDLKLSSGFELKKVLFGPHPGDLILWSEDQGLGRDLQLRLEAIAFARGARTSIYEGASGDPVLGNRAGLVSCSHECGRIAIWHSIERSDAKGRNGAGTVRVLDVEWSDSGAEEPRVSDRGDIDSGARAASFEIGRFLQLSPNGNYLLLTHTFTGTSGATSTASESELWDLWSLSSQTDLRPTPVVLKGIYGPILRAAFSADGQRLALWDAHGISSVLQLYAGKPRIFTSGEIPTALENRFEHQQVYQWNAGRFAKIDYGDSDVRFVDLVDGREFALGAYTSGEPVLDVVWCEPPEANFDIVLARRLRQVRQGHILREVPFPNTATIASVDESGVAMFDGKEIRVYEAKLAREIIRIQVPDGVRWLWLDSSQNASVRSLYAQHNDGSFSHWRITPDGKKNDKYTLATLPRTRISLANNTAFYWRILRETMLFSEVAVSQEGGVEAIEIDPKRKPFALAEYDLREGRLVGPVAPPPGGWPRELAGVEGFHLLDDGAQVVSFAGAGNSHYVGMWRKFSDAPVLWRKLGGGGIRWFQDDVGYNTASVVVVRDKDVAVSRLRDNAILAKATLDLAVGELLPRIMTAGQRMQFVNDGMYSQQAARLATGGLDSPLAVTNVQLPPDLQKEIEDLKLRR